MKLISLGSQLPIFATMSQHLDASASSLHSDQTPFLMKISPVPHANMVIASSEPPQVQTLRTTKSGEHDIYSRGCNHTEDVEMTMIETKTYQKTTDKKRLDQQTSDESMADSKTSRRKLNTDREAVERTFSTTVSFLYQDTFPDKRSETDVLLQLRPSAVVQKYSITTFRSTLRQHQASLQLYKKGRKVYTDAVRENRRMVAARVQARGASIQSPGLNPMAPPFVVLGSACNETLQVPLQTLDMQCECGFFFLSSSYSIPEGYISSPYSVYTPYFNGITPQHEPQLQHQIQCLPSIDQGIPVQPATLNPSASPFCPKPFSALPTFGDTQLVMEQVGRCFFDSHFSGSSASPLNPPTIPASHNFEDNQAAMNSYMDQGGSYQFDPLSSGSSTLQSNTQPMRASQSSQVIMKEGVIFKAPDSNSIVNQPVAARPTTPATLSTVANQSVSGPRTKSSTRRPLPGLPTPPLTPSLVLSPRFGSPPSTPSLGSSPRFDSRPPRHKSHKSRPLLPVPAPKPKPRKNTNPFIDLRFTKGDDSPEIYYKLETASPGWPHNNYDGASEGKDRSEVGPYRKAAVWEFIGQTFEKGSRKGGNIRQRKRFRTCAAGYAPSLGTSNLSRCVLRAENEEENDVCDMEAIQEWSRLMNGGK